MRIASFLILAASCLLAIPLLVLPVMASPGGNDTAVTISASPLAEGPYTIGETIRFTGTNTDSDTTFLYLTGPGLHPRGSFPDSNDMILVPVTRGIVTSYKSLGVGPDRRWTWEWDTRKTPLIAGNYTVFAVSSHPVFEDPGSAVHDSVTFLIEEPVLSAVARPSSAAQGDPITISGTASGHTSPGIAIWIIGPNYSDRVVVGPDPKGSWSYTIDSSAMHLLNGIYHVFAEHPSTDERFDFDLNGDYLFSNKIRSNIFTFRGNGRLYGEAAYTAFSAAINGPKDDDIFVPVSFVLGEGPVTVTVLPVTPAHAGAPQFSLNGSVDSPLIIPAVTTFPEGNGSLPAGSPSETTPGVSGNQSGTVGSPAGDNGGGLQLIPLGGILGIILIAGAGAVSVLRRRKPRTVPRNTPAISRVRQQGGDDRYRTGEPGTPGTWPANPKTVPAGIPPPAPVPVIAFPEELADKYTDIVPVGSGGFAMVYSAYRTHDNQKVAIKIPMRSDERAGRSFLHEIRVWETLHHPNIVEVMATNILPFPYVEMEYVSGSVEGLAKPVDICLAAKIVHGIAEGIRYAHARRCIHRDIKPQNILLTKTMVPKITDWGISKVLEERAKKTTLAGFSLSYAAPEQIAPERFGSTDERTDIWQIGAVFYELVTGSTPFYGDSMMEVVSETLEEDPILPSDYNPDASPVEHIIVKCLAKDPAQRYQSADELLAALDAFLRARDRQGSR